MRVVRCWSREVVAAPFTNVFKEGQVGRSSEHSVVVEGVHALGRNWMIS